MKLKIRQHDASAPQEDGWSQVGGWLAELRDDDHTKPPGDGHAEPDDANDPWARALAEADALAEARARAEAEARARAEARVEGRARAAAAARPVIGDQLRMPIMWCEMGSCISWHADPAALGEADTRARAIGAGWRIDALGRLACPRCQQADPGFWATGPVVLWDRYAAVARAARAAAMRSDGTAGATWGGSGDPGRAAGYPPAGPPEPGRQQPAPPFPRRWS